jgi:hypothetical protein
MESTAMPAGDDWLRRVDGTARRSSAAKKMAKMRRLKLAVDRVCNAGNIEQQAAVLRAIIDHRDLASAHELAGIDSTKEMAAAKYVCEQSARMLGRARSSKNAQGKTSCEKRDAVKVVLTFTAPSPNRETDLPSQRDRARLLGIPRSTLQRVDSAVITKSQQLTASKREIYWTLAKKKNGYSTISNELKLMLVNAFNDHPHVVVSPNTKDTLQVKNADGENVLVRKILTMVGLGTIFSNIVRDNPSIKQKVGERAFCYIVSGLGCVRRFTDLHKTMRGCTECVGLHTLHCSLQAKYGVMHRQIAIDAQRQTTKKRAEEMSRGWGCVALHPKPSDAIRAGTCTRWSANDVPHWDCQTLKCAECKENPVPAEEAREDASAELISFHVYEYKVSLRKDGKER